MVVVTGGKTWFGISGICHWLSLNGQFYRASSLIRGFGTDHCTQNLIMNEIVFEITQEADGGFCAECLTESIFTQGDNWEDMRENAKEAVRAFYFDHLHPPEKIRLHLVRDEIVTCS